jgi:hypothetical protein
LFESAMHVLADPRLVRRVIKRQRKLAGFGLNVPHGHCCIVDRAQLFAIVSESELGTPKDVVPERAVILVARPDVDDPRAVWRSAFHGWVHRHLEDRARDRGLSPARVRERIHRIGQTEFDEIRAVLRSEELLFSTRDDREAYIEFAAFYLELSHFDPDAVDAFFPTLRDRDGVLATLALDVDAGALLERSRPRGAADLAPVAKKPPSTSPPAIEARSREPRETAAETDDAAAPARRGNLVRSILVRMRARESARDDVSAFARRLASALGEGGPSVGAWRDVVVSLATAAAAKRSRRALEARVLHDMQKACVDAERARMAVDVVTWLTSALRRPIVRPLPARVVRVARHLRRAFAKSHRAELSKPDRRRLEAVFRAATACADKNAREVGLGPRSVPERVAREKLCEEILDQVLARGSVSLSQLRDALSRSSLKMKNLEPADLAGGDPILRADAELSRALDGVYRGGEIYLRFLQKVSSIAFGPRRSRRRSSEPRHHGSLAARARLTSARGARATLTSEARSSGLVREPLLRAVGDLDLDPRLADARHRHVAELLVREALPELEMALRRVGHRLGRRERHGRRLGRRRLLFGWQDHPPEDGHEGATLLGAAMVFARERDAGEELRLHGLERFEETRGILAERDPHRVPGRLRHAMVLAEGLVARLRAGLRRGLRLRRDLFGRGREAGLRGLEGGLRPVVRLARRRPVGDEQLANRGDERAEHEVRLDLGEGLLPCIGADPGLGIAAHGEQPIELRRECGGIHVLTSSVGAPWDRRKD